MSLSSLGRKSPHTLSSWVLIWLIQLSILLETKTMKGREHADWVNVKKKEEGTM